MGCVECHGPVQQMETVRTVEPLNMAWCLECHRDPRAVPAAAGPGDEHGLGAAGGDDRRARADLGKELMEDYHVNPSTDCVTCHR